MMEDVLSAMKTEIDGLDEFTDDIFQDGRDQGIQEEREPLD